MVGRAHVTSTCSAAPVADEVLQAAGAILGGRRWYDVAVQKFNGYDGIYGGQWKGPVLVLTHRAPDTDHHPAITFLSGDLSDAVATAKDAAAGKAVIIFGANLAAQCLRADLLDEIVIHLVPILLGEGVRLIGVADLGPVALERNWSRPLVRSPICGLRFGAATSGAAPPREPWLQYASSNTFGPQETAPVSDVDDNQGVTLNGTVTRQR
jgi:dihydrofolate reductase